MSANRIAEIRAEIDKLEQSLTLLSSLPEAQKPIQQRIDQLKQELQTLSSGRSHSQTITGGSVGLAISGDVHGPIVFNSGTPSATPASSMANSSTADPQKLIEIHKTRLHHLRIKQATYGINTPPEVLIEIDQIVATLKQLGIDGALLG